MDNEYINFQQQSLPLQTVESHWKQIYDQYDVNRDGKVPLCELCMAIHNKNPDHLPHHAVERILKEFDSNQDGYLSFNEFLYMMEHEEGSRLVVKGWMKAYVHSLIPPRHTVPSRGKYEEEYSWYPPPIGLLFISLIEVICFILDQLMMASNANYGPLAILFMYDPERRKEAWRFLTYMLVHFDPPHLIFNLLIQIILGIPLEMVHGWYRVLIVYLGGVIAGSLGSSVFNSFYRLGGASSGVYALITAHVASIIMNWSEMEYTWAQLIFFSFFVTVSNGYSLYQKFVNNIDQVGYIAHIAGALAGLILGLRVLKNLKIRRWEKFVNRLALVVYITLMTAAIFWNIFEPRYFPPQTV